MAQVVQKPMLSPARRIGAPGWKSPCKRPGLQSPSITRANAASCQLEGIDWPNTFKRRLQTSRASSVWRPKSGAKFRTLFCACALCMRSARINPN